MTSLLPPNARPQERAAEAVMERLGDADGEDVTRRLWNPASCPPALLGQLRWALQAPGHWGPDVARQRAAVAGAVRLHRVRGTRAALDAALLDAGVVAEVTERPADAAFTVSVRVLNSAALDAELATAPAVQALASRTGRATVRYDVALAANATLRAGLAAGAAAASFARVSLEVAA